MAVRLPDPRPVRVMVGAAAAALVVAVAGCGAGAGAPTVPPQPSLTDPAGAVEDWEFHFNLEPDRLPARVDAPLADLDPDFRHTLEVYLAQPPFGWDARVGWLALPCQRAPEVRVSASSGGVDHVVVAAGPDIDSNESQHIACPSMAASHAVDLRATVAQDELLLVLLSGNDLVADWAFHPDIAAPPGGGGAFAGARRLDAPAGWDVRVAWAASPCQRRPAVTAVGPRRTDEPLLLRHVTVEPGPHLAPGDCSTVLWHALDLRVATEVASGFTVWRHPPTG